MSAPTSPLIAPPSPNIPALSAGRNGGHHRRRSSTILGSIINTATALLHSPPTQHAVIFDEEAKFGEVTKETRRVELKIEGMTVRLVIRASELMLIKQCGACVASIESQLMQPGISSVQISLLAERGVVIYDPEFADAKGLKWDDARIAEEVEDIGFEASVVELSEIQDVELRVYG
jgi:Cu+-exporting ATPase